MKALKLAKLVCVVGCIVATGQAAAQGADRAGESDLAQVSRVLNGAMQHGGVAIMCSHLTGGASVTFRNRGSGDIEYAARGGYSMTLPELDRFASMSEFAQRYATAPAEFFKERDVRLLDSPANTSAHVRLCVDTLRLESRQTRELLSGSRGPVNGLDAKVQSDGEKHLTEQIHARYMREIAPEAQAIKLGRDLVVTYRYADELEIDIDFNHRTLIARDHGLQVFMHQWPADAAGG